jgi:hypothetical protein
MRFLSSPGSSLHTREVAGSKPAAPIGLGRMFRGLFGGGDRARLQHHPEVIPYHPMFADAVIGDAIDVDVFDGEPLPLRRRNASENTSLIRTAPAVVADNEVLISDEPERRPVRIADSAHDSFDRLPKLVEPDFGISIWLMVRNVRMNQTLEIDGP